jgi:pyruvate formate lyase activating enzyme
METGRVFHVQRFSIQDGPGIRTTVFLKGCGLSCAWCHNPEGRSPAREVVKIEERCIRCGACIEVCPSGAAGEPAPGVRCERCGACVAACPTGARQSVGRDVTVADLVAEVERDRVFFEESGGGVTFSGGEPLAQAGFVVEALAALRARSLATALDTCGFASREDLLRAAANADLVLFDLKLIDDERHRELTGVPSAPILENFRALGSAHGNVWVRIPVVPGVNDDAGNLEAAARTAASVPGVRRVHLLPYHATGARKFGRVGIRYALRHVEPPAPDLMERAAEPFRRLGLDTRIGG